VLIVHASLRALLSSHAFTSLHRPTGTPCPQHGVAPHRLILISHEARVLLVALALSLGRSGVDAASGAGPKLTVPVNAATGSFSIMVDGVEWYSSAAPTVCVAGQSVVRCVCQMLHANGRQVCCTSFRAGSRRAEV
jgi:hypothetical protein